MTREEAEQLSAELRASYALVWRRIEEQLGLIQDQPQDWTPQKLRQFQKAVEQAMGSLDAAARAWIQENLPGLYSASVVATNQQLVAAGVEIAGGATAFRWTPTHQQAITALANELYEDLLGATAHVSQTTKQLVRKLTKESGVQGIRDISHRQATGRQLRKTLERNAVSAVIYRNGSRHGLAEYSQMAIRTTTGIAMNQATINAASDHDVAWFQCIDGPGCGWTSHGDGITASGKIVTAKEAKAHPLSHPNCRRTFGPRPDLATQAQAEQAEKEAMAELEVVQRSQVEQDRVRIAAQQRRANRLAARQRKLSA